ncbi:putative GPI ethanolamine phosphate transferase 3 [Apostichopus japonicus]|uniref:Putative GPI ethanolamine phosphate transferase 3 n=1 Tax=Stichopus japonicus TaxID=307972 RepID=A0A2G8KPV8_STIJA|nr:putative GPI ethanolamine phosphate transferase 3 [Apostichopus japonicus]
MPTDSVLFVLGDHGMTKTGDHGVTVQRKLVLLSLFTVHQNSEIQQQEHVAQIDLVPSVSLLLGIPIPFSNLGRLIPDLFTIPSGNFKFKVDLPQNVRASLSYVCALDRNARQVKNYINLYHNLTGAFPSSSLSESKIMVRKVDRMLQKIASNLNSETDMNMETLEEDLVLTEELLTSYLDFIREMCHNIWAQFDDFSINVGVCILLGLLSINILPLLPVSVHYFHLCFLQLVFLVSQWKSIKTFTLELAAIAFVSPILQKISMKARKLNDQTRTWKTSKSDIVIGSLCCAHSLSLTSNSYVMYESYSISHVVNSVICFVFIGVCVTVKPPVHTRKRLSLGKFLKVSTLLLLFLLASRLGHLFWSCREEQPWCDASPFLIPLSNLRSSAARIASLRYISSGASLYAPVFLVKWWFKQKGNLGVSFLRSFPINYGLPLAAICIFLYWALLAVPSPLLDKLPPWQHIFLPQMAYLMLFVSFVSLTVHPVCAHLLPKEKARKFGEISRNIDHEKQEEVKSHSRSRAAALKRSSPIIPKETKKEVPVVCGLGTVYSANLMQFLVTLYLLLCLLLGDGLVLSMVLMAAQVTVVLTVRTLSGEENHPTIPFVPVWLIAVWSLMSMQYFFTTGHQATIPSIRFETAFIGYHGDYPSYLYWIPAVLILLNTFAGQVMFAAALPLALLWPLTQKNRGRTSDDGSKGEMQLQQDPNLLKRRLSHLIMHYISFQALQTRDDHVEWTRDDHVEWTRDDHVEWTRDDHVEWTFPKEEE